MKKYYYYILILLIVIASLTFIVLNNKSEKELKPETRVEEEIKKEENVDEPKEEKEEEKEEKEEKTEEIKEETKEEIKEEKPEEAKVEPKTTNAETTIKLPTKASITDKKITFDSSFKNVQKDEIEDFLREFFERYYRIIANLEYEDISDLFFDQEYAYIYKTALDLLIENRRKSNLDLTLSNVKYELKVNKYKVNNDKISFTVLENCSYRFALTKDYPTAVYNITNNFDLVKVDEKYKISSYKKVQDFYVMITDLYKKQDNYKSALDKIKADYLVKFDTQNSNIQKMRQNYLSGNYTTKKCDHAFDREKAYDYALTWVGRRNTSKWHTYSANCVNFVSQVMYAGGIPMDHTGSQQWKWYSTKKNTKNTASGFVYSWTYVPSIVSYFKNNTGYGLCGKYNENLYLGDKGDVIVVGSKGPTRHVVSVIGQIKDENGKVVDLMVNSNTVDLEYFPLSAYAYPYKILMKVYGWNN